MVDYKTITDNNIIGTITDKDLNALILDETNDTDSHRVDTYSPLTDFELAELDRLINQVIGGKRKSKKARKSRKPRKPNKNKSRKGKSRKSTSCKK